MSATPRQIQSGDIVKIGSSGWTMRVLEVEGEGAYCVWTVDSQQTTAWVSFACLERARDRRRQSRLSEAVGVVGRVA
jgi:hypothetical protein